MPLQSDKLRLLRRIPDIRFEEEARGYSKDQVDRVLANLAPLADEIERLQARLTEAENRAASAEARLVEARTPSQAAAPGMPPAPQPDFDETLRNTLVSAQRQADTTVREATEEAERLRTEAEFQSNALLADARDQSAEMTTEAVAYRERLMEEAAAERSKLLDEARDEAKASVEAVENELVDAHEAERARLIQQIQDLESNHKLLQDDVSRFEAHLKARAAEVRSALDEVTAALDDPERLRANDGLAPADIDDFDEENYPPIAVEVVALSELEAEAQMAAEATARPGEVLDAAELDELAPETLDSSVEADDLERFEAELEELAEGTDSLNGSESEPDDAVDVEVDVDADLDEVEQLAEFTETGDYVSILDPEVNTDTQVVPPFDQQGAILDDVEDDDDEEAKVGGDPFLNELRRVTNEEPQDDAIANFLDDKQDRSGGGWFGRRK
jgi:cell division septum initiation protein DivIVA